jgi:hypothetical protein
MMDDVRWMMFFLKIKSRNRTTSPAIVRTVAANVVPLQSEPREGKFATQLRNNCQSAPEQKFHSCEAKSPFQEFKVTRSLTLKKL